MLRHVLALLPGVAAALARAQSTVGAAADAPPDGAISAPIYTPEQCDRWVGVLVAADGDASAGLSEDEYYAFLSGIEEPPYIAEYFASYDSFDRLPWVFRVVHKSLACHCEKLGRGGKCCEGDNAEVLLLGLNDGKGTALRNVTRNAAAADGEYKDLFCQQLAFVLTKAIASPAPTSAAPTSSPVAVPTASPVKAPTASPTAEDARAAPAPGPTSPQPTSPRPTATSTARVVPKVGTPDEDEEDDGGGGLGWGAIVAIVVGAVALLALVLGIVAHQRRQKEEAQVREFAGASALDADLADPELAVAPRDATPYVAGALGAAGDDDDDSQAPSVWSGDEAEDAEVAGELDDDGDGPRPPVGSSLAAMGAASTVAARLSDGGKVPVNRLN